MEDDLRARRDGTQFEKFLGLRLMGSASHEAGIVVEMDLRADLCGPLGSLDGGVIATMVDMAGVACATHALRELVATLDLSISYLAPGRVGPIRAIAVPLRVGRDTVVVEARVIDVGKQERLVAAALLTAKSMGVPLPPDIQRPPPDTRRAAP
jgi:uncharacterized protein (TIGR00369 family)